MQNQNDVVGTYLSRLATSRRHFLRASAIAGGLMAAGHLTPAAVRGISLGRAAAQEGDLGILNSALTLEHFENALYRTLIDSGLLSGQALAYAQLYGGQECEHVTLLTGAISDAGGNPATEQESYTFPELGSQDEVLETLVTVEDVGASAYLGAAPLIQNTDYLTVAVQIHSVEAYHATGVRLLSGQDPVPFAFADPRTGNEVTEIVSAFGVGAGMPPAGGGALADQGSSSRGLVGVGAAAAAAGVGLAIRGRNRAARAE